MAIGFPGSFQRLRPEPITTDEVFNSISDFELFLTEGTAVPGMVHAVRVPDQNIPSLFIVTEELGYEPVGSGSGITNPEDLISEDQFNSMRTGTDGKLFTPMGGSSGGNAIMTFQVEDGHLIMYTNNISEAQRFSIEDGELFYTFTKEVDSDNG